MIYLSANLENAKKHLIINLLSIIQEIYDFGLLETIIIKNKILKNVCLVNDSENDFCTTDMNGIQ